MDLTQYIKDVTDYPKVGVVFKDITPLLGNGEAFKYAIDKLAELFSDRQIDIVLGIDARGFLLAAPVAYKLRKGIAIVRKPGKLPRKSIGESYDLEYGSNALEIHEDAIEPGQNVLIIDDVLATGGTMEATCKMVKKLGGEIAGIGFLIELDFLQGRNKLEENNVKTLVHY
ncbi:MAG: adenine phosphoribosyltransferase [Parcubacteria group bacterium CG10_big_fil_rev_8_21_14_0_10_36_14]|nr:MAG: adenine phosphoribosyltransferase [Parcubacteria group bacterium CG10_big_fil_rev_8_21_14_0_10_36_14]